MIAGTNWGRERITFVEIDQPLCARRYSDAFDSPSGSCQAVLGTSGDRKCYNTRATCQDAANYAPTDTLALRFSMSQDGLFDYGPLIPSLVSVDTTPLAVNLGGMDKNASSLGQREAVVVVLDDHLHSDLFVDPYRLERKSGAASAGSPSEIFDPGTRGTFWGKWIARNPYSSNYVLRVRDGYRGDGIADMDVRTYLIDRIDGPVNGRVKITAKDLFSRIEAQKAKAPAVSRGELAADFLYSGSPTQTTFQLSPSGIGALDYPSSGYAKIGDEIVGFTRSGDICTTTERGAFNTTPDDHQREDAVQVVLVYTIQLAVDIVYDLLCNYTALGDNGSPAGSSYIDKTAWNAEAETLTDLYTAVIAEPTPVQDLIGELAEQVGFTIWPDVSNYMIEFKALRAATAAPIFSDDDSIVEGSIALRTRSDQRASEIWFYYAQIDPTKDLDERSNYRSRLVTVDADAEDSTQYGTAAVREVFSRWVPQFGRTKASDAGERLIAMFRDPPVEAQFALHADRLSDISLAQIIALRVAEVQDETGAVDSVTHAILEIKCDDDLVKVKSQSVVFAPPSGGGAGDYVIYIENDDYNLNLRTIFDSLYAMPAAGSPSPTVRFIVEAGFAIGSTSTATPALTRGSWPSHVSVILENRGRIQGHAGNAGNGGDWTVAPTVGQDGGPALDASDGQLLVDNSAGQIYGGAGGGGGGGYSRFFVISLFISTGGGGGGGGAGNVAGAGGAPGSGGSAGAAGTADAGGAGGAGGHVAGGGDAGAGGDGGDPGDDGAAGAAGNQQAGAAGGTKGDYIVGNSNVIWISVGDVRGGTS